MNQQQVYTNSGNYVVYGNPQYDQNYAYQSQQYQYQFQQQQQYQYQQQQLQYGFQSQQMNYQPVVILQPNQYPQQQVIVQREIKLKIHKRSRRRFSDRGICWVIILLLVFWPLFWLPFVIDDCYDYD